MEVAPLSANQRCILEAVVSGQVGIFSRSNLSTLVTSMWERRTLAKRVKAYMQPLPHFKRIQEVSLPDFIICSKDRETKPAETQQKLEIGFEKAWLSPLSYEM